jgi:hypothetical protein
MNPELVLLSIAAVGRDWTTRATLARCRRRIVRSPLETPDVKTPTRVRPAIVITVLEVALALVGCREATETASLEAGLGDRSVRHEPVPTSEDGSAADGHAADGLPADSSAPDGTAPDGPSAFLVPDDCSNGQLPIGCGPTDPCPDGSCCVAGFCVSPGEHCASNLGLCADQSCGGCGALNQRCCIGEELAYQACVNTGLWRGPSCSDPTAVCMDAGAGESRCVPCGAAEQPCCLVAGFAAETPCTSWKLVCNVDGMCSASCDHVGQPCCIDGDCADGGVCMTYPGLTPQGQPPTACIAGSACGAEGAACTSCGIPGLPCCDGGGCIGTGDCLSGMCPRPTQR